MSNRLAGPDKRWSLAFTNRSFIVACVAFVAAAALMIGLPFPMPIDVTAETVYAIITVAGLLWAGIERMLGQDACGLEQEAGCRGYYRGRCSDCRAERSAGSLSQATVLTSLRGVSRLVCHHHRATLHLMEK